MASDTSRELVFLAGDIFSSIPFQIKSPAEKVLK